jgi:hypothetical protein
MADSAKVQLTRWVDSQDDLCDEDKVAMTLVFINVDDATCQAYMAMDERRRKAILKTAAAGGFLTHGLPVHGSITVRSMAGGLRLAQPHRLNPCCSSPSCQQQPHAPPWEGPSMKHAGAERVLTLLDLAPHAHCCPFPCMHRLALDSPGSLNRSSR